MPASTMMLLVTCSRDEMRRDLAVKVMRNLAELAPAAGLAERFVIYDNASTYDDHLALAPAGCTLVRSTSNDGYWSAIKWTLDNRGDLVDGDLRYIYIVESDLYHHALAPLAECERFLDVEKRAACVRTQEFSVRWRMRYDKRLRRLPFHVERSSIALSNAVSGERAWFRKVPDFERVHLSNLHAKLPALNRLSALEAVFARLAEAGDFSEGDFFREMMQEHPLVGMYDGGLYHALVSWSDRNRVVMASYASDQELESLGYRATRKSRVVPVAVKPSVQRKIHKVLAT